MGLRLTSTTLDESTLDLPVSIGEEEIGSSEVTEVRRNPFFIIAITTKIKAKK